MADDVFAKGFTATMGVVLALMVISAITTMLLCGGCIGLTVVGGAANVALEEEQRERQEAQDKAAREARLKARREAEREDVAPDAPE
jgi:hypothetical protein